MALLRDAKRCCVGAGEGEEGLDDVDEEAATEEEAEEAADALDDDDTDDGDGDAPRRGGSGELAALAASLVDLGDRRGALPRESGVTRAGAAPIGACAEGAAAPQRTALADHVYQRTMKISSVYSAAFPVSFGGYQAGNIEGFSIPSRLESWSKEIACRYRENALAPRAKKKGEVMKKLPREKNFVGPRSA